MATVTQTKTAKPAGAATLELDPRRALLAAPLKPRKRTPREALPTALHLAFTAGLSMAVFSSIFIAVGMCLGDRKRRGEVQNGCSLAMVTVGIIAMPFLGNSVIRGLQRILGVMIGGWLFCGIYYLYQAWWFEGIMLGVFAFLAVASSHFLIGKQYLYPPMLVAAFVVCVGFDSVQEAVAATVVKTVGIGGGILVYTVVSTLIFPYTATQHIIDNLGLALRELRDMADVLMRGRHAGATHGLVRRLSALAAAPPGADAASAAVPAGRAAPGSGSRAVASASTLAATIPALLRDVMKLLPDTAKERFLGRLPGGLMCYIPAPFLMRDGAPFAEDVLAVLHVLHTLHRSLFLMMTPGGAADAGVTSGGVTGDAPAALRGSLLDARFPKGIEAEARRITNEMSEEAVSALQEFASALPCGGRPKASAPAAASHVARYRELSQQLYKLSLELHESGKTGGDASASAPAAKGADAPAAAAAPRERWQWAINKAIAANRARRGAVGALRELVGGMLARGDVEAARWCATLLLLSQLGVGLERLQGCMDAMLPKLPGVSGPAPTAAPAPAKGGDQV